MRQLLKFVHTLGAIGFTGAMASLLVLVSLVPQPEAIVEYAKIRAAMDAIATWILLPSIGLVLFGGLMSMAWTSAFHNAGWAWFKLATGILVFEGTLTAVQGPVEKQAQIAAQALAGQIDPATIRDTTSSEWLSLWVLLGVALVNVVLGIWRPRSRRRQAAKAATSP
ncbi:MAG: hypothetical protein QNJ85_12785 [Gammaproteobacteria bacterium]|nr:hypothetical protein [Gammaproteobacteria bacterium]